MIKNILWKLLRACLFRADPESVHHFVLNCASQLAKCRFGRVLIERVSESHVLSPPLKSRIGLAAGFDKNAEYLDVLELMGFGFVEVGTVTPRAQEGNPKPRLMRDVVKCSLFNRMGFNGLGAEKVASNLRNWRSRTLSSLIIGVNLGKNKETPDEQAAQDYLKAAKCFRDLADYLVINVSSPNTPGLRALQSEAFITQTVKLLSSEIQTWHLIPKLYLKLAPELEAEVLDPILSQGSKMGLSGFILTNTLAGEWVAHDSKHTLSAKKSTFDPPLRGGWSGKVLTEYSRRVLEGARPKTDLTLISVGGIMTEEEAKRRFELGADFIQVYTGWIFGGPFWVSRIGRSLDKQISHKINSTPKAL